MYFKTLCSKRKFFLFLLLPGHNGIYTELTNGTMEQQRGGTSPSWILQAKIHVCRCSRSLERQNLALFSPFFCTVQDCTHTANVQIILIIRKLKKLYLRLGSTCYHIAVCGLSCRIAKGTVSTAISGRKGVLEEAIADCVVSCTVADVHILYNQGPQG